MRQIVIGGLLLSIIPCIYTLYLMQSWEGPIVRNEFVQISAILVILLFFMLWYLKRKNLRTSQIILFPFKTFGLAAIIYLLSFLIIEISLVGNILEGTVSYLPRAIVYLFGFFAKSLIPMIIVSVIGYLNYAKSPESDAIDEHLM